MRMARWLNQHAQTVAYGTDVINLNRTELTLCLSAGERLPFASSSIDTVCLVFVLHHVRNPIATLTECLRVSRHQVVVAEDVYVSPLELSLLRALDWLGNRSVSSRMSLPFGFRRERTWTGLFERLGAHLANVESIRPVPWRPSRHRLFVLTKHRHERGEGIQ
jgi:ubiquinone/menaquinone biosynthesis C-methylase UbiE